MSAALRSESNMFQSVIIKRALKRAAGWSAVFTDALADHPSRPCACILVYHRIADVGFLDRTVDDWNVPPDMFERQIASLAKFAEIVPLPDLPGKLRLLSCPARPLVALTFDDGYANFCTQALPILRRYQAPATVFVVTSLIGQPGPLPFDRWSLKHSDRVSPEVWRSLNWAEIETCLESGLVTVGGHSHRHRKGLQATHAELVAEAEESRAVLSSRLGEAGSRAYAYPYGSRRLGYVPPAYVEAVRAAGYELAVTTDLGLADGASDPYLLPRVEAHAVDAPAVVRAKVRGALGPYYLTDYFRRAKRAV
jgi:peptidoglycan/xylan/chitin deacetylase (PgdA/CDA1 family)